MGKTVISSQFASRITLLREKVSSFSDYPFSLPLVRSLESVDLHEKVTIFIGENGSGKSTLLEGLAVAFGLNPEGGSRNFRFATRHSHSNLCDYLRIAKGYKRPKDSFFLRAESFFNVATEIERLDEGPGGPPVIESYGGKSLHEQSHGESFLSLLMNRFRGEGLYILDEPEAALSPQRQLAAMARMHQLVEAGSQFIVATHSPIMMAYPDAWLYACTASGLERMKYSDTEHYQVMRDFLVDPSRMLKTLFEEP